MRGGVLGDEIHVCGSGGPRTYGEAAGEGGAGAEPAAGGTTQPDQSPSPPQQAPAPNHTARNLGVTACSVYACASPRRRLGSPVVTWVTSAGLAASEGKAGPHPEALVLRCDITGTLTLVRDGKDGGWGQQKGVTSEGGGGGKDVEVGDVAKRTLQPLGPKQ